jgi:hypothetical protein
MGPAADFKAATGVVKRRASSDPALQIVGPHHKKYKSKTKTNSLLNKVSMN